jgi:hypothetical protein
LHYVYYSSLTSHPQTQAAVDPSPFPPVDPKLLNISAHKFQELMKQAFKLVEKISTSQEFAYELMNEAQLSNAAKVEELIKSTGITMKVETTFTPTGIRIKLDNSELQGRCCQLAMLLHW